MDGDEGARPQPEGKVTKTTHDSSPFNKARLAIIKAKQEFEANRGDFAPTDVDAADRERQAAGFIAMAQLEMRAGNYGRALAFAMDAIRVHGGN